MPQFHFTIIDGSCSPFHEDMDLPNIEAAKALALRTSCEIISDLNSTTWGYENDWAMHMSDDTGQLKMVLRFSATAHL